MATVNVPNRTVDRTVQIFDRFYNYRGGVSAQEFDSVYSYLRSVFNTTSQANNFTTTMFRISDLSGIPIMDLLDEIRGQTAPQVTAIFAFYLNTLQSPTTLLGVKEPTVPNYYVAHNIKV